MEQPDQKAVIYNDSGAFQGDLSSLMIEDNFQNPMTKVAPKNVAEEEDKGLESDIVMIEGEYQSLVNETTKKD